MRRRVHVEVVIAVHLDALHAANKLKMKIQSKISTKISKLITANSSHKVPMLKVLPRRLVFRPEGVKIDFFIFGT